MHDIGTPDVACAVRTSTLHAAIFRAHSARYCMKAQVYECTNLVESDLVLSHFAFEGFRTVLPALRLRSGQAPAGIQGEQAAACGSSAWIPAFAGMTQHSSTPQNHHDRLLGRSGIRSGDKIARNMKVHPCIG